MVPVAMFSTTTSERATSRFSKSAPSGVEMLIVHDSFDWLYVRAANSDRRWLPTLITSAPITER